MIRTVMAAEIAEQPAALAATLAAVKEQVDDLASLLRRVDRVLLFARGSSDTAATYARYLLEVVAGVPAGLGAPSVATLYDAELDLSTTLVVVCSQSGHTEELVRVAEWAAGCGAPVVAVTNDGDSPLAHIAARVLVTRATPERAVPATKSHSTCLLALAQMALAMAHGRRRVAAAPLFEALDAVPDQAARMVATGPEVAHVAGELAGADSYLVAGRGYTYATALEVALKIEETSAVPCLGLSQADLQHGPISAVGDGRPVIVAAPPAGPTLPGLASLVTQVRLRGAPVVALGGDETVRGPADLLLPGPDLPEPLAPIPLVVVGQLFAEALSRARGHDPDHPPGLTKVTQTA